MTVLLHLALDIMPRGIERGVVKLRLGTNDHAAVARELEVGGRPAEVDLADEHARRVPHLDAIATPGVHIAVRVDVDTLRKKTTRSAFFLFFSQRKKISPNRHEASTGPRSLTSGTPESTKANVLRLSQVPSSLTSKRYLRRRSEKGKRNYRLSREVRLTRWLGPRSCSQRTLCWCRCR